MAVVAVVFVNVITGVDETKTETTLLAPSAKPKLVIALKYVVEVKFPVLYVALVAPDMLVQGPLGVDDDCH